MTDKAGFKIEGIEELAKQFDKLALEVQLKVAKRATRAAAEVIKDSAIGKVPVGETGRLASGFVLSSGPVDSENYETLLNVKTFYAFMVEFGHRLVRRVAGRKRQVGFVGPKPFLRPAFDETAEQAIDAMARELKQGLKI